MNLYRSDQNQIRIRSESDQKAPFSLSHVYANLGPFISVLSWRFLTSVVSQKFLTTTDLIDDPLERSRQMVSVGGFARCSLNLATQLQNREQ